jgi:hypothetical protein
MIARTMLVDHGNVKGLYVQFAFEPVVISPFIMLTVKSHLAKINPTGNRQKKWKQVHENPATNFACFQERAYHCTQGILISYHGVYV